MKIEWWSILPAAICVSALLVPHTGAEEQDVSGSDPEIAAVTESQAEARAILMDMAGFLSGAQSFSVNIRSGYDAVQASGQKIEFGAVRRVTVKRPDRLRIEVEQSDGDRNLVLFDGKDITVSSISQNVYAQAARPGDLDGAIAYFIKDLNMRLPLAVLLVSRLPAELETRVQTIDYVEETNILGVRAHHLAARTETVDFQVWVSDGEQPLPLRAVLTYKAEDGQPQFWAQFSDWNLSPAVTDATFTFTPPEGASKIAFLAQLPRVAAPEKQATEPTGGQP